MKTLRTAVAVALMISALAACGGSDPGLLKGTWRVKGVMPMTLQFRAGESEALGVIEKVSYKTQGNDVIVTYESGIAKGSAMRITMTGPNSARSELGTLTRVQ
jgi:hypothetical protein